MLRNEEGQGIEEGVLKSRRRGGAENAEGYWGFWILILDFGFRVWEGRVYRVCGVLCTLVSFFSMYLVVAG
jgi:hypothetical protein